MQRWEYYIANPKVLERTMAGDANELGAQGWELVAVTNNKMYFKRPVEVHVQADTTTPPLGQGRVSD